MPIIIPKQLPAHDKLRRENIFVMDSVRAGTQDIRPIEIAILNLMPTKIETETQLMRLIANTPLQVNITLIRTATYESTHTAQDHMQRFYKSLEEVKKLKFDGLIVTGAPVENMSFESVKYWAELQDIFTFADQNVTSTIYICWGAQAALYHYYGIGKIDLDAKLFGVFPSHSLVRNEPLLKGLDDVFYIPHSRHTAIDEAAVRKCKSLKVLAEGEKCGISILKSADNSKIFFTGHAEYDRDTLKTEYLRDLDKGLNIARPENYFEGEGTDAIRMSWKSTGNLLFYNWLNYYVYQVTPYSLYDEDAAN